jgi:NAD(P)-dependent dehydrogenase (short-subunit alcohol dehydrogenase family)
MLEPTARWPSISEGEGRGDHVTATFGQPQEPSQAYSDSKACDVALALAWRRRLPKVASAAVDPGGVRPNWPVPALPVMLHRPRTHRRRRQPMRSARDTMIPSGPRT